MNGRPKNILSRAFWVFLGALSVYLGYGALRWEIGLRKHEKAFLQIQHPANTTYIASLSSIFNYYPATYIDDSIQFKSVNLVGELRSYGGNWDEIKNFYRDQTLDKAKPVAVIPVEVHQEGERIWLDVPNGYVLNPGDHDILSELQARYGRSRLVKILNDIDSNLYLAYGLWQ